MTNPIYQVDLPRGKFLTYNQQPKLDYSYVQQIHGTEVLTIKNNKPQNSIGKADGIGFTSWNFARPLAIVTADCLPVLILGSRGAFFLHMGWRGICERIIDHPVIQQIDATSIFIGPHISWKNYEVGPEFTSYFPNSDNFVHQNGKLYFNLSGEVINQAKGKWPHVQIATSDHCTFDQSNFHSVRKEMTVERNWNLYIP